MIWLCLIPPHSWDCREPCLTEESATPFSDDVPINGVEKIDQVTIITL